MTIANDVTAGDCIPIVDVTSLFDTDPGGPPIPDRALAAAARDTGFACVRGLPREAAPGPAERGRLLGIFGLNEAERRRLYRRKFAPENSNTLPSDSPDLFAPFEYGDFLWNRVTSFVEFRGLERERPTKS